MVDELHVLKKRIRTLSESSRSDGSTSHTDQSESSPQEDTVASSSPPQPVRSRKQNIRELREEFEDYPELYGIRRSARSRKEPLRFKAPEKEVSDARFREKRKIRLLSSSDSNNVTDSETDDWDDNILVRHRSVRTRGNRVNYKSAFVDDSFDESNDEPSERSNSNLFKPINQRTSYGAAPILKNPKSLVKSENDNLDQICFNEQQYSEDDDDGGVCVSNEVNRESDEEADVIEEILTHAIRRKGATGNPTTLYNTRLEKDLNAGFDPKKEDGELQFLIKWRNWSHIHSTWETESSLRNPDRGAPVSGMKKFYAYQASLREKTERLRYVEREELETVAYEEERDEQLLQDKMNVERIVAHSRDPETNTFDYLIKWFRLDYRFCTWESGKVIHSLYESAVQAYETRCSSSKLPNRKCEVLYTRPKFVPLTEQPIYLSNSRELRLRDYQLDGINWLIRAWTRRNSVILADEMGLGKTIQTIGFLSYLFNEYQVYGPFLIVVPLSTISSWQKEFQTWSPEMNTIIYTGDHVSRQLIREHEWSAGASTNSRRHQSLKFNVCVTTYEILLKDKGWLSQVNWAFLGVDEAHRLKNDSSQLYKTLKTFDTNTRLLVTGTPLQNTMKELWALLHFIMPDIFPDWEEFEQTYSVSPDDPANKMNSEAFHNLHKTLKPFLLRRVKKDVESSLPEKIEQILRVDMTKEQANIYRLILARNYDGLMKVTRGHKASFINIVMELKKCCNHAHLIAPPSEADHQYLTKEDRLRSFLRGSGKGTLLDKLLQRLKSKGHRVLIFSQMVRMLDLIADYLNLRGWGFQRLDGSIRGEVRKQALDHFNSEGSTDFCFLLSTRAGGLGINLATADTVIIFDSDWNPQNDLQAQARAHRIGQTKQVSVYRFVTRESVEEKIIESATRKMVLDHLVIQRMDSGGIRGGRRGDTAKGHLLTEILRYGAEGLFKQADEDASELEVDIDDILNRAETRDTEATAESNPANALLSSFKVVNLDAHEEDIDIKSGNNSLNSSMNQGCEKTWDQIIPSEFRGQVKAEEDRKTLVELELGPRRRRPVKTFQAGLNCNQSSSEASDAEENDKISQTQLTEKEIRALVRAIRHFARPMERIDAIAADAELPDHSEAELREVVDAVLKGCRAAMEAASVNSNEESQKQAAGGKGPVFQYGRVSVAARPLLQSLEYLETLHQCLPSTSKEARMSYELPFCPKLVAWSCNWDNSDDVRLLAGVYEHGYDNWEAIKLDSDLGLGSKLLPVSQTERPQANHLRSRVDYLLKMLAKRQSSSRCTEQQSTTKKRRKEDKQGSDKSSQKLKTKSVSQKSSVKHTPKALTVSTNPVPKSAEFVDTDDSSSESDEDAGDDTSMSLLSNIKHSSKKHEMKSKTKHANKIKSEKKNKHSPDSKPPILLPASSLQENLSDVPTLFTKEEEDEFRNMQGPIFIKCKKKFVPIKKHFKELEDLERTNEQNPTKLANVVLQIGDHIHSIVDVYSDKEKRHAWKNYLWEFVHIFSKNSTEELRHIYRHAVKRRLKEERRKTSDAHLSCSPKHYKNSPHNNSIDYYGETSNRHYLSLNNRDSHNDSSFRRYHTNRSTLSHDRNDHHEQHSGISGGFIHGGQNKYGNDWSTSTSSHKEFSRDRNNNSSRFNNAFNRTPGQSNVKHHKFGSFSSHTYSSPRVTSSHHYHQHHLQHDSGGYSTPHYPWTNTCLANEIMTNSSPKVETQKYTSHSSLLSSFSDPICTNKASSHFSSIGGQCPPPPPPLPPVDLHSPLQYTSNQLSRDPRLSSTTRR
ncbi:Chromodomain-helicase-DNA-binding protein 1 [Schistosoma japonicum]|nr:Chromodomain-helicase-DNA-binding protein 1 [Schistosoma japonicum]